MKTGMARYRGKSEAAIQAEIFQWHWNNRPGERGLLFMIHNNAVNRVQGAQLKAQGMVPGVSDLAYLAPDGRPVMIEVKKPGGSQSPAQKKWEELVRGVGYRYVVVRSLEEAKEVLGW